MKPSAAPGSYSNPVGAATSPGIEHQKLSVTPIAAPPGTLPYLHRAFIERALKILEADARVLGVAAAGSYADDAMDEFSDIDLIIAVDRADESAMLSDRPRLAATLGSLVASFGGEHINEPRLLVCLYDPPLLHVDLKFVALQDAAQRVDEPVVLWEREGKLTKAFGEGAASYPCPHRQFVEDRFWVWIHYAAAKVGRGELFEAIEFLSYLRCNILAPLKKRQMGLRPNGVRRLEQLAPQFAEELKGTAAPAEAAPILKAIRVCIQVYLDLRSESTDGLHRRLNAEQAALKYLAEIETRYSHIPIEGSSR
jgi:predicted nucleotidyltransferase